MPHQPASTALSHIRVLDLTRVRSGPTAVRQLGDWGADVIKIEQPASLEADGSLGAGRNTADWQNLQRNRRSLTLNLKDERGKEVFRKLVKTADVVVENFRPDVKDRLGIDYESLKALNPKVILASISGFGQTGPYAKRPGFDQIAQGMGGLMSITGEPEGGPMRVGIPIADLTTGLFCAIGILTALLEREKSGEGQWLHTSLLQSQIFMLDFQAARYLMRGEVAPQVGNEHPTSVPTNRYLTKDGAINIAVAGDETWRRLCKALGRDAWAEDEGYANNAKRAERRVKLNADIAEVVAQKSTAEWVEELTAAGVPCGPIYRIDEMFEDPQVQHLGIAQPLETDPFGESKALAQPFELTRTPSSFAASPPTRGQHTDELLEELGFSDEECEELKEASVI
ncbi:MAG: CoA transferase [Rhizobiaceae bacterium]|nr:CoA transferase [Hyphomicrobiales bacterium]NRB29445.1 CoA transferase [Rhizobiaceae bacterium]